MSFDIISYDTSTLVLKLSDSQHNDRYLIGSTYILKRPVNRYLDSPYSGRWINDYTLVKGAKDTVAERYQYQFMDNGNVLETSANDSTIHIKYDFWWFANDNCIVFSNTTAMERFTIIQAPIDNHMILQPYKSNYQYLLTKVK